MSAAKTYHFADFTTAHYRQLLRRTAERYRFTDFEHSDGEGIVLWRHDVDFSVNRALRLAQIEHEEGVSTTYFFHLHSEYYNVLEKAQTDLVRSIRAMGHHIGLHFDTHYYGIKSEDDLHDTLRFEKTILDGMLGTDVRVFSFHNTTPFTMGCSASMYGGLINAYAENFQRNFEYCSDSNGYWRYNRLADVVCESTAARLHILTHPEWWQEMEASPWERIDRCITGRADAAHTHYAATLRRLGMKNIDDAGPRD